MKRTTQFLMLTSILLITCIANAQTWTYSAPYLGTTSPIHVNGKNVVGTLSSGDSVAIGMLNYGTGFIGVTHNTLRHALFGTSQTISDILFVNKVSGTYDYYERMRINRFGRVGIGTPAPDTSALLHVSATNKGVLIPSVALTATNDATTISLPAKGLLVWNNTLGGLTPEGYWYNAGTSGAPSWVQIGGAGWSLTGNGGTTPGTLNFIGTTDNKDWVIKTNNTERMRVLAGGNVGIGTSSPSFKLHVTNSTNAISVYASNSYSTSDTYAVYGTATGSGTTTVGGYFTATGGGNNYGVSAVVASGTNNYAFYASGTAKSAFMGNVGIGTTAPGYKLDVSGDARVTTRMGIGVAPNASYDLYIQNSAFSVTGTWGGSDIRLKKDTSSFTDGLNIIKQIHPINYRYNGKAGVTDTNQFFVSVVAQQLQTVMPNAIKPYFARFNSPNDTTEAPIELLSINTQPLLFASINAIKELAIKDSIKDAKIKTIETSDSTSTALNNVQQQSIDSLSNIITSLQNQLNQLASLISECCNNNGNGNGNGHGNGNNLMPSGNSGQNNRSMNANDVTPQGEPTLTNVELSDKNIVVLNQNVPNPFAEQTTISYYLSENTVKAQILFYNAQGKLIQSAELVQKGKGQLNVFANDLTNGIYTYTLVVDDKIIETKKMLKQ